VNRKLEPFLPVPRVLKDGDRYLLSNDYPDSIGKLHAFYGNMGVLIRAYSYILSLGAELKTVSEFAVLSANYLKERLRPLLHLPFDKPCMHECVFTDKDLERFNVSTLDVAKRLIDFGFHPPTIYFPLVVQGAIMIEPTESESKETLDQFVEAMEAIVREAESDALILKQAPTRTKVRRLDETGAARNPVLKG
jgi:glycine dehydrogenase subunit 2